MDENFSPESYIQIKSAVEGIQVYMPAPQEKEENREILEFDCPQCGATTAYGISSGGLTCSHCGYYEPVEKTVIGKEAEEFEFTVETMERAAHGWGGTRKDLECQNCGARTSIPEEALTHTCAFCGSNKVLQRATTQDSLRPRNIIPFRLNIDECMAIAREWLGSSWMTPSDLKRLNNHNAFTGIYLPFWTFDATSTADWRAEVGHTETERYYDHHDKAWKTRTKIVWRWETGHVMVRIDDLLVEGTARISKLLLSKVKNYDMRQLVPYEPDYLAGFNALAYDVSLERAWEVGRHIIREQTRDACRNQASTSNIRNFSMSLDFSEESWRYILMPAYVGAYTYQGKVYQVILNGQTGSIHGQRPVDWRKIWLVVTALIAPGLLLGLLGLVTIPIFGSGVLIGGIGAVLLVIGSIIAVTVVVKANRMDDT